MNSEARGYLTLAAFILGVILSGVYGRVNTMSDGSAIVAMLYYLLGGVGVPSMVWRACSATMPKSEISNQPES